MELKQKSYKDINLKQYKKIVEIYNREFDSDLEKDIAVLALLMNVEETDLYNLSINELKTLLAQMTWIKNYDFKPEKKIPNKMIIDGEEYTVNPDLDKFSVAQYMDFENFWNNRNERMGNLLAIFIIPKGKKYNEGYDVIELANTLEEVCSLDYWNNVCFFFLKNWLLSTKASLMCLDWKIKKMMKKEKNKEAVTYMKQMREMIIKQIERMG